MTEFEKKIMKVKYVQHQEAGIFRIPGWCSYRIGELIFL